jgi:NAD(P)-dependent dehydrogenase (short-subunit alcohol dehydrogenase family)
MNVDDHVSASVRNVLVTGGTSGLGRAIATGYAASGHDVIICARTELDCERVAEEISQGGVGRCRGIACDLSRVESIVALSETLRAQIGELHVLVNSAGAVAPGPIEAIDEADWDRVVDVNLKAVFFTSQNMVPLLRTGASASFPASIINIGSYAGSRVGPRPHYPYTAAKAALRYLTQSLAKGLAVDHINVNAIALGVFPQDSVIMRGYSAETLDEIRLRIPAARLGEAADIVGLTGFLSSRAASYITGATIPLDGGMHI